jgi:hypothetical protein
LKKKANKKNNKNKMTSKFVDIDNLQYFEKEVGKTFSS